MTTDQIIQNIIEKQDQILSNLNFEDIAVYIFIKNEYDKGDILNNFVFQYVFKSWYRIDKAGWSNEMKNCFFKLLSEKQIDLKIILSKIYEIPTLRGRNTIQFVFATKLLHTIDNEYPIFDSMVSEVTEKKVNGNNKNEKINSCIEIQNYLKELYNEKLKTDGEVKKVISEFRSKFEKVDSEKISDIKILDFIIWSLAQLN